MVSDETLDRFAVIGTYDRIGQLLIERFGDVVTDAGFSIPVRNDNEREILAGLVKEVQAAEADTVRAAIVGEG